MDGWMDGWMDGCVPSGGVARLKEALLTYSISLLVYVIFSCLCAFSFAGGSGAVPRLKEAFREGV
jgi:hypothetical protein